MLTDTCWKKRYLKRSSVDIVGFQEVQLSPNEQTYPRYNKYSQIFLLQFLQNIILDNIILNICYINMRSNCLRVHY